MPISDELKQAIRERANRETRRFWIQTGLHPTPDDPCQA
jgi:hypothetical protein